MFRDLPEPPPAQAPATPLEAPQSIGALIGGASALSADKVEKILAHQRQHKLRFGESAVALGFANEDDVVRALATQFQYPLTPSQPHGVSPEVLVAHRPFSPQAEVFRGIRAQIMLRLHGPQMPPRAIAVVSHDSGDGRSYFAANIAAAFGQIGGRTLLIDADLRNSRQHSVFGVDNRTGLSTMLAGRGAAHTIVPVPGLPSLFVLPAGIVPPNPLELIERQAFGLLMADVLRKFDHVVVDTPAFALGMDGPVLAAKCGAALLVARRDRSHMAAVQDLVATLSEGPAELAGVIFNEY